MKDNNSPKKPNKRDKAGEPVPHVDEETKEILKGALTSFLREKIDEKETSRKNVETLIGVVEEFLNSFIILGYTFEGTPVQYICAHNQQQADSLATLINKFFQHAVMRDDEDIN